MRIWKVLSINDNKNIKNHETIIEDYNFMVFGIDNRMKNMST